MVATDIHIMQMDAILVAQMMNLSPDMTLARTQKLQTLKWKRHSSKQMHSQTRRVLKCIPISILGEGNEAEQNAMFTQQAVYNATNTANIGCMQKQIEQLYGMTKLVIPATSVCPQPMPLHNSWSAPTTTGSTT